MKEEKRYTLEDFDFSKTRSNPPPKTEDEAEVLLRLVEGAGVALWRNEPKGSAELIPPQQALFSCSGGYTWGYRGTGCQNLSFAIVGRVYEFDRLSADELHSKAHLLLDTLLSGLNQEQEYTLPVAVIRKALGDGQRSVFG